MKPQARCGWALAAALTALLGACATQTPPASPATPKASPVTGSPTDAPRDASLAAFAARQRVAAEAAERQGRWAEALWAWDVLRALRPEDAELTKRRSLAQDAVQAGVAERLQRARVALQRADHDAASRLFLDVLALAPAQAEAANGLRAIERERVKRQHLGQLSRNTMTRRANDPTQTPVAKAAAPRTPSGGRNEVEHASLLQAQGETASAIAVLTPLVAQRHRDPAAQSLLADLHYRQAEALAPTDLVAAIASLQRSLQLDRANPRAVSLLRQLNARPAPVAAVAGTQKAN